MVPLQFLGNWLGVSTKLYHELLGEPAGKSFQELVRLSASFSLYIALHLCTRGKCSRPLHWNRRQTESMHITFLLYPMPAIQFNVCLFVHLFVQTGFELILV